MINRCDLLTLKSGVLDSIVQKDWGPQVNSVYEEDGFDKHKY